MSERSSSHAPRPFALTPRKLLHALLCMTVFVSAILLTYHYVLTTDPSKLAGRYDVHRYYGPETYLLDYGVQHGELPLWNPLTYCGKPNCAIPQTFVFYPPNLIRGILNFHPTPLKTQTGFVVLIGLHLVLTAAGMYLLARAHGLNLGASFAAVFVFTFSALMVRRSCEYHFVFTISWLPIVLVLIKRLLDAPKFRSKIYFATAAGLLFGVSVLGGFVQIVNVMALTMGAYAFLYRLLHLKKRPGPLGTEVVRGWICDVAAVAMLFALGAMVASVLLLPTAELAAFSARQKGTDVRLYADLLQQSPLKSFQDFVTYAGMKYEAEALRGAGIAALLLALAGLTHHRWRDVILFCALYLMLVDCSLGPPLPVARLVAWLTPFSSSSHVRSYDFALLPFGMLAGLGVEAVSTPLLSRWRRAVQTSIVAGAGVAVLIPFAKWVSPHPYLPVSKSVVILPAVALTLMLVSGQFRTVKVARFLALLLMPVLIFTETLAWNWHYVPYMTKKYFSEREGLYQGEVTLPQDNSRTTDPLGSRMLYALTPVMNGCEPLHIRKVREVISGPRRGRHYFRVVRPAEVTQVNNRGLLCLKRFFWLARQWVKGPLPGKEALFPSATTVFLKDVEELPVPETGLKNLPNSGISNDTVKVPLTKAKGLYDRVTGGKTLNRYLYFELPTSAAGRAPGPAGAVHSVLCLHYRSSCFANIDTRFPDRDSNRSEWGRSARLRPTGAREALVEIPLPDFHRMEGRVTLRPASRTGVFQFTRAYVLSDQNDEDGLIRILSRRLTSVELEVGELQEPRILTFLDVNYPGWEAYLDSEPVPILLADDVFKAVVVPAGTHHIRFEFSPKRVYAGMLISLVSAFGSIAVLMLLRPKSADSQRAALQPSPSSGSVNHHPV